MDNVFIKLRTRSYKIVHGFDKNNQEIIEDVTQAEWVNKYVALARVQSFTEKFVRMHYSHDRIIYWEYDGGLKSIERQLKKLKAI